MGERDAGSQHARGSGVSHSCREGCKAALLSSNARCHHRVGVQCSQSPTASEGGGWRSARASVCSEVRGRVSKCGH
eukprot:2495935-Amphidinium_carterae.1